MRTKMIANLVKHGPLKCRHLEVPEIYVMNGDQDVSMCFRAQSSRAQSAQVPSSLNRIESPIGCHLGVIDPNPFAYPIISHSSRFLMAYT